MQIVIDIPEEDYERLKEYKKAPFCSLTSRTYEAISNGIPLPKGHGDLIDRNDLLTDSYCIDDWGGNEVDIVDVMTVKMAHTIIEADKESEEE